MRSAARITVSTFGSLVGLIGIEHGLGEALQGNVAAGGMMILSWPDSTFFKMLSGEPAFTVVPNMLITGILVVCVSIFYLLWAVGFVQRKNGGLVLALLNIPLFLLGGGIFPPVLGLFIGIYAIRIQAPLHQRRVRLPVGWQRFLGALWPWAFSACLLAWLIMFPGIPTLNYTFGVDSPVFVFTVLSCMFGFLALAGITGLIRDVHRQEPTTGE